MAEQVDPKYFGIKGRTIIERIGHEGYVIVINRKSRIIMADGRRIVAMAEKIKAIEPDAQLKLKTSAPVCSKTVAILEGLGITIDNG